MDTNGMKLVMKEFNNAINSGASWKILKGKACVPIVRMCSNLDKIRSIKLVWQQRHICIQTNTGHINAIIFYNTIHRNYSTDMT